MKTDDTRTIRWTGTPIEVAIALGLLGPAWAEGAGDEGQEATVRPANNNYHSADKLSSLSQLSLSQLSLSLGAG